MRSRSSTVVTAAALLAGLTAMAAPANASPPRTVGNAAVVREAPAAPAPDCDNGQHITLSVWTYYTSLTVLSPLDALFNKVCPNVKVDQILVPFSQLDSKLLATASTHQGPDVLLNNYVVDFPELQRAGVMLNLSNYWASYPDKSQYPASAQLRGPNGAIYTVLSYTNLVGFWYNKTILDQYGITTPPTTIAQMTVDMKKVVAGGKYQGLAEAGVGTVEGAWLFMPLLLDQNVNYCNLAANKPKVTAAFGEVSEWAKDKLVPSDTSTWTQSDSWQSFVTGKYAFGLLGNWNLQSAATTAKFSYGTGVFPANDNDGKSYVFPGGEGLAIGAYTKYPGVAWQYLESTFLSRQGSLIDFEGSGSIPIRFDVSSEPAVKKDKFLAPFITAAHDSARWPDNPQTAAMQTAIGQAVSGVISGQLTASAAAAQAISGVTKARQAGGGGC
jgi:multiple sugar transport system substrate-binding protein